MTNRIKNCNTLAEVIDEIIITPSPFLTQLTESQGKGKCFLRNSLKTLSAIISASSGDQGFRAFAEGYKLLENITGFCRDSIQVHLSFLEQNHMITRLGGLTVFTQKNNKAVPRREFTTLIPRHDIIVNLCQKTTLTKRDMDQRGFLPKSPVPSGVLANMPKVYVDLEERYIAETKQGIKIAERTTKIKASAMTAFLDSLEDTIKATWAIMKQSYNHGVVDNFGITCDPFKPKFLHYKSGSAALGEWGDKLGMICSCIPIGDKKKRLLAIS